MAYGFIFKVDHKKCLRSDDPCGCFGVRLSPPVAAPASGRLRGGMGVEAPMLRELTRYGCLNEAATQRSEFRSAPRNRTAAGCPFAMRRGRRLGVAFSLVTFFWRRKRKLLRRRAHSPAPALSTGIPPNQPASPGFDKLSPNGWEVEMNGGGAPDSTGSARMGGR